MKINRFNTSILMETVLNVKWAFVKHIKMNSVRKFTLNK